MLFKYLSQSSIKTKIILIISLPILAYLSTSFSRINNAYNDLGLVKSMARNLIAVEAISEVVKHTQVERGKSAVFATSDGKLGLDFLESQRNKVDEALKAAIPKIEDTQDKAAQSNLLNSLKRINEL